MHDTKVLLSVSLIGRGAPGPFQPAVAQRDIELEVAQCVGGVSSPLLANIYLSLLDRHFQQIWETDMSPPWRRQHRRRKGLPNYRLVRFRRLMPRSA
jgi:hypothetical protein